MAPVLRIALGIILGIIGLAGLALPLLPGWMFLIPSFLLLFPNSSAAEAMLKKMDQKMPRAGAWLRKTGAGKQKPDASANR